MSVNRLSMYSRGLAVVLNIPFSVAKRIVLWYQERTLKLPPLSEELTQEQLLSLLSSSIPEEKAARQPHR